jgi:hypothetical protein
MTTTTGIVIKSALEIADLIAWFILVHADLIIKKNCCECQIIEFILYRIKLHKLPLSIQASEVL